MIPSMLRVKSEISAPAALTSMFAGVEDAHLAGMGMSGKVPSTMEKAVITAGMMTREMTSITMATRPEVV